MTKEKVAHEEAELIEKTLVSKVNMNPGTGVAGGHIIETYRTTDGRVLVFAYGNGGGSWYYEVST